MERKEVFDGIMQFVPQGFHNSVKESTEYLKRLHVGVKRNINFSRCTLEISPKGVEYIQYEQSYCDMDTLTWRALEQLFIEFFPRQSFDLNNQTSLFGDLEIQLNTAF